MTIRKDPYTTDTIGKLIDGEYALTLYCEERHNGYWCHWYKKLDLEKLALKLGRDHGSMHWDLVPHLWCLKCGSRNVSLRLSPPTFRDPKTGQWRQRRESDTGR